MNEDAIRVICQRADDNVLRVANERMLADLEELRSETHHLRMDVTALQREVNLARTERERALDAITAFKLSQQAANDAIARDVCVLREDVNSLMERQGAQRRVPSDDIEAEPPILTDWELAITSLEDKLADLKKS